MMCWFLRSATRRGVLLATALLGAVSGCGGGGPDLVPVAGTVTLDGNPLANKSLMFTPVEGTAGHGAAGSSDADGKFTLNAMVPGATRDYPGIEPGRYRVMVFEATISAAGADEGDGGEPAAAIAPGMPAGRSNIPAIYSTEQSPLVIDVPPAGGELTVPLKSNPNA